MLQLVGSLSASASCPGGAWVDIDSPGSACTAKSEHDGSELELVFSDEFNHPGRTFHDGDDSRWTALERAPSTNEQVNYYNASLATTNEEGQLALRSAYQPVQLSGGSTRYIQTAMIQTWNKFCFSGGGIAEVRARMPGRHDQPGLWPAFWLMGNLGRATFTQSTDGIWPFVFDECVEPSDADCEANQCTAQLITACDEAPGFGFNPRQGRGAPEIDVIEVQPGNADIEYGVSERWHSLGCPASPDEATRRALRTRQPLVSTSLQAAPGMPTIAQQRPAQGCAPLRSQWYPQLSIFKRGTTPSNYTTVTNYEFWGDEYDEYNRGGLQTDAYSVNTELGSTHWSDMHTYRVEWQTGSNGYAHSPYILCVLQSALIRVVAHVCARADICAGLSMGWFSSKSIVKFSALELTKYKATSTC